MAIQGMESIKLENFNKVFKTDPHCWIGRIEMEIKIERNGQIIDTGEFGGTAHFLCFSEIEGCAYGLTAAHNLYLRANPVGDEYDEYFATSATFYLRKTEQDDPYECEVDMDSI